MKKQYYVDGQIIEVDEETGSIGGTNGSNGRLSADGNFTLNNKYLYKDSDGNVFDKNSGVLKGHIDNLGRYIPINGSEKQAEDNNNSFGNVSTPILNYSTILVLLAFFGCIFYLKSIIKTMVAYANAGMLIGENLSDALKFLIPTVIGALVLLCILVGKYKNWRRG